MKRDKTGYDDEDDDVEEEEAKKREDDEVDFFFIVDWTNVGIANPNVMFDQGWLRHCDGEELDKYWLMREKICEILEVTAKSEIFPGFLIEDFTGFSLDRF